MAPMQTAVSLHTQLFAMYRPRDAAGLQLLTWYNAPKTASVEYTQAPVQ